MSAACSLVADFLCQQLRSWKQSASLALHTGTHAVTVLHLEKAGNGTELGGALYYTNDAATAGSFAQELQVWSRLAAVDHGGVPVDHPPAACNVQTKCVATVAELQPPV